MGVRGGLAVPGRGCPGSHASAAVRLRLLRRPPGKGGFRQGRDPKAAEKAHRILQKLQDANRLRLRRAFGDAQPVIVVVARRESERTLMQAAIDGLFGSRLAVAHRSLPEGVHGLRADLPGAEKRPKERFAERVEAWRPLAEALAAEHGACHVLVQADEWYSRKLEDRVNKPAGRHALAVLGNANVQYLLPPGSGWRGLALYLHRIQAAVYDLMFGHSALVSEIGSLAAADFPDSAQRPRSVIGISVVTQARLRNGGSGGQICLASRIDAASGRTTARVGWHDGAMQWTEWKPFFEAMKHVASLKAAQLGSDQDMRKDSFQAFAEAIIDEAVADGDRPLVMLDATSAAGLWPWLTDTRISGPPSIGPEGADKSREWRQARLVRVRCGHAGRVLERAAVRYEVYDYAAGRFGGEWTRYCPTAVANTVEIFSGPGSARHYWVTSGYAEQTKRGLSVYRVLDAHSRGEGSGPRGRAAGSGPLRRGLHRLRHLRRALPGAERHRRNGRLARHVVAGIASSSSPSPVNWGAPLYGPCRNGWCGTWWAKNGPLFYSEANSSDRGGRSKADIFSGFRPSRALWQIS